MTDIVVARALHVLAVVVWIGGVAMATMVVLPAVRRGELGDPWLQPFDVIERRFVWQARAAAIVAAITGFYMIWRLDLWSRFRTPVFWWMHAMVGLWLLFAIVLFIIEPFFLHSRFQRWATTRPRTAFAWLHGVHYVLLVLSIVTILGAVAGSRGWTIF